MKGGVGGNGMRMAKNNVQKFMIKERERLKGVHISEQKVGK